MSISSAQRHDDEDENEDENDDDDDDVEDDDDDVDRYLCTCRIEKECVKYTSLKKIRVGI